RRGAPHRGAAQRRDRGAARLPTPRLRRAPGRPGGDCMSVERELAAVELAERARTASRELARASSDQRARALQLFAAELESPKVATAMEAANAADLRGAA